MVVGNNVAVLVQFQHFSLVHALVKQRERCVCLCVCVMCLRSVALTVFPEVHPDDTAD